MNLKKEVATGHTSVLLKEAIDLLDIKKDGKYIDATLGAGGHAIQIAKKGGQILGLDADPQAIKLAQTNFAAAGFSLKSQRANFVNLKEIATEQDFLAVEGILFDLGVGSFQFDTPERGFSFRQDAPLDMRMDPTLGVCAQDLVNGLTERELEKLFTLYGEEGYSKRIAKRVVTSRLSKPISTTLQLASLIEQTVGFKEHIHPATRVFQALRIAVNDELNSLKDALPQAFEILGVGGRLVVISFHSLEDRVVKNYFRDLERGEKALLLTDKPLVPTDLEIDTNPRARSAKLRALEKI